MKALCLVACFIVLACDTQAGSRESFISPDKRFEAYIVPNNTDDYGAKLFVRAAGSKDPGIELCGNDRWIAVHWSPDSRFLAVEDHNDGHVSDAYVYRITRSAEPAGVARTLRYQSPDPGQYDTKWVFVSWNTKEATAVFSRSTLENKRRFTVSLVKDVVLKKR